MLDKKDIKRYRQIGHQLNPIITIGNKGLSDSVLAELNRALNDHELIKIKLPSEDKAALSQVIQEIPELEVVQQVGNILLVYRAAAKPNPKLSNVMRSAT